MGLEGWLPICLRIKKLMQQIFIPYHVLFTQHKMIRWLRNTRSEVDKRLIAKLTGTELKWVTQVTVNNVDGNGCIFVDSRIAVTGLIY
jgi:hypothetical protein